MQRLWKRRAKRNWKNKGIYIYPIWYLLVKGEEVWSYKNYFPYPDWEVIGTVFKETHIETQ